MNKKFLALLFFLAFIAGSPAYSGDHVQVYSVERDNQFDFYADNHNGYTPYQLRVNFRSKNIRANTQFPFYTVLRDKEKGKYLFSVLKSFVSEKDLKANWKAVIGDPLSVNVKKDLPYILPFEDSAGFFLNQGYNGRFSHKGWQRYSLDFGMPIGTPVCAARDGVIVDLKQDSSRGGRRRRNSGHANFIILSHGDGTYSGYVHLMLMGSAVEIGTKVTQGQIIGYSGSTGRSSGPHLHFMVFKPVYMGRETMPVKFIDRNGGLTEIKSRKTYYSYRPIRQNQIKLAETSSNSGVGGEISPNSENNLGGF